MSCNCKHPESYHPHYHHKPHIGFDPCYEHDGCPRHCDCYYDINSLCVVYKGEDLEHLGVKRCMRLEDILKHLDKLSFNKFFNNHAVFHGTNLGEGVGLYRGITPTGAEGFKSFESSSHIIFTDSGNTVQANINLDWLKDYLTQDKHTTLGSGVSTINIEGNIIQHRGITSTDRSIEAQINIDGSIDLGVNYKGIKEYLRDTRTTLYNIYVDTTSKQDTGEGTIDNPFSSFSTAYHYVIGGGTPENPEFKNRRIILLSDTSISYNPYINTTELYLRNVKVELSGNNITSSCISIVGNNEFNSFRIKGEGTLIAENNKTLISLKAVEDGRVELLLDGDISLEGRGGTLPLVILEGGHVRLKSKGLLSLRNNNSSFLNIVGSTFSYDKLEVSSNGNSITEPVIVLEGAIVRGGILEVVEDNKVEWELFYSIIKASTVDTSYYINSEIVINSFINLAKGIKNFILGTYRGISYIGGRINTFTQSREKEIKLELRSCTLGTNNISKMTDIDNKTKVIIDKKGVIN